MCWKDGSTARDGSWAGEASTGRGDGGHGRRKEEKRIES